MHGFPIEKRDKIGTYRLSTSLSGLTRSLLAASKPKMPRCLSMSTVSLNQPGRAQKRNARSVRSFIPFESPFQKLIERAWRLRSFCPSLKLPLSINRFIKPRSHLVTD
jgi:hypothetical protein